MGNSDTPSDGLMIDIGCGRRLRQCGNGWDVVRCIRDGVAGYVARRSAADEVPKETAGASPLTGNR